jgi:hypothetical protein
MQKAIQNQIWQYIFKQIPNFHQNLRTEIHFKNSATHNHRFYTFRFISANCLITIEPREILQNENFEF